MLEVGQDDAHLKVMAYQQADVKGYNKKVKVHSALVLKKKTLQCGSFLTKVGMSFKANNVVVARLYKLEDLDGKVLPHTWNVEHIRKYY